MYPDYLIADRFVTLYGICIAIGILCCILILRYCGKRNRIEQKFMDFVEITGYIVIAIGFGAAYLFQAFYDFIKYGTVDWSSVGITFLGGLIGGVGSFIIIYNIFKKNYNGRIVEILPFAPICITIAHAFGRVGCFFAGCCYGKIGDPSDPFYFLCVEFKNVGGMRYPTNLMEAIFLFLLCGTMFLLYYKKNFKYNFLIYLPCYGIWRYLIEFVRDDERGQIFRGIDWISPSQLISLIMILATVPVFFLLKYMYSHMPSYHNKETENLEVKEAENKENLIEEKPSEN